MSKLEIEYSGDHPLASRREYYDKGTAGLVLELCDTSPAPGDGRNDVAWCVVEVSDAATFCELRAEVQGRTGRAVIRFPGEYDFAMYLDQVPTTLEETIAALMVLRGLPETGPERAAFFARFPRGGDGTGAVAP